MAQKEKTYQIKVPVYTSAGIEGLTQSLFGYMSYKEMNEAIKQQIKDAKYPYFINSRVKTKTTIIDSVICKDVVVDGRDALLLRISAYNTNLYGGYFEDDTKRKREITNTNRIGSDNNFVLLFPMMLGISDEETNYYFLMLVYEDPSKDTGEVVKLAKVLLNKMLNIPMQNIKMETVMEELRISKRIPELNLKFSSLDEGDNNVDARFKEYLVKTKTIEKKERKFEYVPSDLINEVINDTTDVDVAKYDTREAQIKLGRKEYRIKHMLHEANEKIQDTIERIFNASVEVTKEEMDNKKIYDAEFIVDKLTAVMNNYLSYGDK